MLRPLQNSLKGCTGEGRGGQGRAGEGEGRGGQGRAGEGRGGQGRAGGAGEDPSLRQGRRLLGAHGHASGPVPGVCLECIWSASGVPGAQPGELRPGLFTSTSGPRSHREQWGPVYSTLSFCQGAKLQVGPFDQ